MKNINETINALENFRSGWANDIREGWNCSVPGAKDVKFELYTLAGNIILALEQVNQGHYRDKMAMIMTKDKLQKLVKSKIFDNLSCLSEAGFASIITTGTRHHIRVMFEALEVLTSKEI